MSLASSVQIAMLSQRVMQVNFETREVRNIPIFAAKKHGRNCPCEACSALYMQRTKDMRIKAMMPGNVDMGNRQPAVSSKKMRADDSLPNIPVPTEMKSKRNVKQVAPPKKSNKQMKPSQLMHDKGVILKGKEFSDVQRGKLAKKHQAEPDGSYPIANVGDLKRAKQALGRSKNVTKTRAWINKRAKQLGEPGLKA